MSCADVGNKCLYNQVNVTCSRDLGDFGDGRSLIVLDGLFIDFLLFDGEIYKSDNYMKLHYVCVGNKQDKWCKTYRVV